MPTAQRPETAFPSVGAEPACAKYFAVLSNRAWGRGSTCQIGRSLASVASHADISDSRSGAVPRRLGRGGPLSEMSHPRRRAADPLRGMIHPLRGVAESLLGVAGSLPGMVRSFRGMDHPFPGMVRSFRGMDHPFPLAARSFPGASASLCGAEGQFRGLNRLTGTPEGFLSAFATPVGLPPRAVVATTKKYSPIKPCPGNGARLSCYHTLDVVEVVPGSQPEI